MAERSSLPRYVQISEMLTREIVAGLIPDGARLPPERQMAQDLSISVGTLRKALAEMEGRGLLVRRQGSGNYVRASGDTGAVYAFLRLERPGGGGLPTATVLSVERVTKPADLPPFGPSDAAHRVRRLRRLDSVPVAVEEIWLDASHAARLEREELSESLYFYYRRALGLMITRIEDRVGLDPAPDWSPPEFGPAAGTPTAFVERVGWSHTGERAEFSRTWFDHQEARYISRLGQG